MKKLIMIFATLGSITSFAEENYNFECYAKVKCPKHSACADRRLVVSISNSEIISVKATSNYFNDADIKNHQLSEDEIKISGKDATGDSFSAKLNLNKISNTEEFSEAGRYNILRIFPVKLECRKL